jgi:hypothetical protein
VNPPSQAAGEFGVLSVREAVHWQSSGLSPQSQERHLCRNPGDPIVMSVEQMSSICRYFGPISETEQLLAMQKVEDSNPFSRFA